MREKILLFSLSPNLVASNKLSYKLDEKDFNGLKGGEGIHPSLILLKSYLERGYKAHLTIFKEESYSFDEKDFKEKAELSPEIARNISFERFPVKGFIGGTNYKTSRFIIYFDASRGFNYLNAIIYDAYKSFISGLKARV